MHQATPARRASPWACAIFRTVKRLPLIALLWLLAAAPLTAGDNLYRGEVLATGSGADGARSSALLALNQVLIRLTGKVGEDPVAEAQLPPEAAESMALGREFVQLEVPQANGTVRGERRLRVEFDANAVDQLIDEQGWVRWGGRRPLLLTWVSTDRQQAAAYSESDPWLNHLVDQASARYGLALVRPILDGADRLEVQPADIRGGFVERSEAALQRYAADGVIMLDLDDESGLVVSRWAWQVGPRQDSFRRVGASLAEVIDLGLGRIAADLAERFGVRGDTRLAYELEISGVLTTVRYVEIRQFLSELDGIETFRLTAAEADRMRFSIEARGHGLQQRIEATGPLVFVRRARDGALHYRFQP